MGRLVSDPLVVRPSRHPLAGVVARGVATTTLLAHWVAVVLPLAYLVVLPAVGAGALDVSVVLWTVCCHAVAVLLGHPYEPAA